jgi:hypothetical protein
MVNEITSDENCVTEQIRILGGRHCFLLTCNYEIACHTTGVLLSVTVPPRPAFIFVFVLPFLFLFLHAAVLRVSWLGRTHS